LVTGTANSVSQTVTLNYNVPVGTGYRLVAAYGMAAANALGTSTATQTFPAPYSSFTITGNVSDLSTAPATTANAYNCFFNIQIDENCETARVPVIAKVGCSSIVNLKLNIQGYYDADAHAMRPVMANQGVGSSTTDVDDVTVELRDSSTSSLVASVTARLHTDGTATATFGTAPSGSFYIVVKHRNAVQTWSATAQTVGATPLTYDFTTAANKAYGDNMVELESGVYGFYSGDLNQDESVDILDSPSLYDDNDNFAFGYFATDLNGDGSVDILDFPLLFGNSDNFIYSVHP
jgi:hypothetical protein